MLSIPAASTGMRMHVPFLLFEQHDVELLDLLWPFSCRRLDWLGNVEALARCMLYLIDSQSFENACASSQI